MLDLEASLIELSRTRPVFHSEADFQHALAWRVHEDLPSARIRLETPIDHGDVRNHLDVTVIVGSESIALELKYKTRPLDVTVAGERFILKNQAAHPPSRYDFMADIERLEAALLSGTYDHGIAVFLTNDPVYWEKPSRNDLVGPDFQIHDGRDATGVLSWAPHAATGTMKGREGQIKHRGTYSYRWKDYARLRASRYGAFRYLAVPVHAPVVGEPAV